MNPKQETNNETIPCVYCDSIRSEEWASENGYKAVRCADCGIIYVNPRPGASLITEAVKTGVHRNGKSAIAKREDSKVQYYRQVFQEIFKDRRLSTEKTSWLDVGAGYGEVVEAVTQITAPGSIVLGLEPMTIKAEQARARGLNVQEKYLTELDDKFDFVSLINVFSHIPDFRSFLSEIKGVLKPGGEFLLETGNTADVNHRREIPGELDLPDHLVFAGQKHLAGFLEEAGFKVVVVRSVRVDGIMRAGKNFIKALLGSPIPVRLPYSSKYRSLIIRARLGE